MGVRILKTNLGNLISVVLDKIRSGVGDLNFIIIELIKLHRDRDFITSRYLG
jgi:hypothetical protein